MPILTRLMTKRKSASDRANQAIEDIVNSFRRSVRTSSSQPSSTRNQGQSSTASPSQTASTANQQITSSGSNADINNLSESNNSNNTWWTLDETHSTPSENTNAMDPLRLEDSQSLTESTESLPDLLTGENPPLSESTPLPTRNNQPTNQSNTPFLHDILQNNNGSRDDSQNSSIEVPQAGTTTATGNNGVGDISQIILTSDRVVNEEDGWQGGNELRNGSQIQVNGATQTRTTELRDHPQTTTSDNQQFRSDINSERLENSQTTKAGNTRDKDCPQTITTSTTITPTSMPGSATRTGRDRVENPENEIIDKYRRAEQLIQSRKRKTAQPEDAHTKNIKLSTKVANTGYRFEPYHRNFDFSKMNKIDQISVNKPATEIRQSKAHLKGINMGLTQSESIASPEEFTNNQDNITSFNLPLQRDIQATSLEEETQGHDVTGRKKDETHVSLNDLERIIKNLQISHPDSNKHMSVPNLIREQETGKNSLHDQKQKSPSAYYTCGISSGDLLEDDDNDVCLDSNLLKSIKTIKSFGGRNQNKRDFDAFILELNSLLNICMNKTTRNDKEKFDAMAAKALQLLLVDDALLFFSSLGAEIRSSYRKSKEALRHRFADTAQPATILARLHNFQQQGMKISALRAEITQLTNKYLTESKDLALNTQSMVERAEFLNYTAFLRALDANIHDKICDKGIPNSFQELYKMALDIEQSEEIKKARRKAEKSSQITHHVLNTQIDPHSNKKLQSNEQNKVEKMVNTIPPKEQNHHYNMVRQFSGRRGRPRDPNNHHEGQRPNNFNYRGYADYRAPNHSNWGRTNREGPPRWGCPQNQQGWNRIPSPRPRNTSYFNPGSPNVRQGTPRSETRQNQLNWNQTAQAGLRNINGFEAGNSLIKQEAWPIQTNNTDNHSKINDADLSRNDSKSEGRTIRERYNDLYNDPPNATRES